MARAEALLIGGRSGVGKTTVAWEVSARLRAVGVAHAIVEGDLMGQVHPAPEGDPDGRALRERNLAALWANFAALGHRRLIYTNTLSVLPEMTGMFERAMGPDLRLVRVLLTDERPVVDIAHDVVAATGWHAGWSASAHSAQGPENFIGLRHGEGQASRGP